MVCACTVAHHMRKMRKASTSHCKGRTRKLQKNSTKSTPDLFEELPPVLIIRLKAGTQPATARRRRNQNFAKARAASAELLCKIDTFL